MTGCTKNYFDYFGETSFTGSLKQGELKPCPFCGRPPRIQKDSRWPRSGKHEGNRVDAFEVVCDNSNCPIYHADNKYFLSEEDAIKAWNRGLENG